MPPDRAAGQQRTGVEVAHQDLIRRWPQVHGWVNANRVALLLRQEVADAAGDWFAAGADPQNDELLRHTGSQLALAETLPQTLPQAFNERERAYLDACHGRRKRAVAAEERQRRRELDIKGRWLKIVAVIALLAMIFAVASTLLYVEQQRLARVNLAQALVAQAQFQYGRGQGEHTALLARQAYAFDTEGKLRVPIAMILQTTAGAPYFSTIAGEHQASINSIAFSPDGQMLASASQDRSVSLMNMGDPTLGQTFLTDHTAQVNVVAFHPEPRRELLASGSSDGTVRLWHSETGDSIGPPLYSPSGEVRSLAFDGNQMVAAGTCRTKENTPPTGDESVDGCRAGGAVVRLWSLESLEQPPQDLAVDAALVCAVAFSVDTHWLAVAGCGQRGDTPNGCEKESGPLLLWNMWDLAQAPICLNAHRGDVRALAFSPDGRVLASGGTDADVRLWNVASLAEPRVLRGHDEGIRSLAFSGDGQLLASGGEDGSVGLWVAPEANFNGPACSSLVPVPGFDGCAGLWIAATQQAVITTLGRTTEWVRSVAFRGGSRHNFASTNANGTVRLWQLGQSGGAPGYLFGHGNYVRSLDFAPNDGPPRLASTGEDGTLRLWTLGNDEAVQRRIDLTPGPGNGKVNGTSVAFNCDGTRVATGSYDGVVRVWDPAAETPTPVQLENYRDGDVVVAFSPTEDLLVSGTAAATVQFWNPETGNPIGNRLLGPTGPVTAIAFSPDGGMLAVAYGPNARETQGSIRLWDLRGWNAAACGSPSADSAASAGGQPPPVLASYPTASTVASLSFHPKDRLLAAGARDGSVHLWNIVSGREVRPSLEGHGAAVRAVEFSPDGSMLATGSNDQTVLIWSAEDWNAAPIQIAGIGEWVRTLSFSPDSETLAVANDQGAIRLILPRTATVAEHVCQRVTRNLSPDEWSHFVGEDELTPFEGILQDDPSEYQETCPGLPSGYEEPTGGPGVTAMDGVIARWEEPMRRSAWTRRVVW